VALYKDAAVRAQNRAATQLSTTVELIKHRMNQKDWAAHVKRVRVAFKSRGGTEKLRSLREDFRLQMLEGGPVISADVAELSLVVLDGAVRAASGGDLNKCMKHLLGIMDFALRGVQSPEIGRQSIPLDMSPEGNFDEPPPIRGAQDVKG